MHGKGIKDIFSHNRLQTHYTRFIKHPASELESFFSDAADEFEQAGKEFRGGRKTFVSDYLKPPEKTK